MCATELEYNSSADINEPNSFQLPDQDNNNKCKKFDYIFLAITIFSFIGVNL